MSTLKATTRSIPQPLALRQRLEDAAQRLGRGKNWIVVQAFEEYLAKWDDRRSWKTPAASRYGPALW